MTGRRVPINELRRKDFEVEFILLILFILGFVIVTTLDTLEKRRKFLTELNKDITNK